MKARVLVGESVFEDATLTIFDEMLHVEFDAEDLDAVAISVAALSELQATPNSSKDLEKDEREAMEQAWPDVYIPPTRDGMSYEFEEGWIAAKAHFEARLQQVEAERNLAHARAADLKVRCFDREKQLLSMREIAADNNKFYPDE